LRILVLTDYFYPHIGGGVEKVVHEVSKLLARRGLNIVIVTLNSISARDVLDGLKIYRIRSVNLTRMIGIQLSISLLYLFKIYKICRRENPDLIHLNNRFFLTTLCSITLKCLLKKTIITTLHLGPMNVGSGLANFLIKVYERTVSRWIIRSSDQLIAVSEMVRQHAINLGAAPNKVVVIPNGVDIDLFQPKEQMPNNPTRARRVAFVGRLIFNKGIQYLVEAAPYVLKQAPATEFIVVGDGPLRNTMIRRCKELGVLSSFSFLGLVPSVADVLKECQIFVRPSLTEGMPLTILEAMSCGLPVLVTKNMGVNNIVIPGKTGVLLDPGNVRQLASSLVELINNYELCQELGHNARLLVEECYSWERTANATLAVYKESLSTLAQLGTARG
jgi:glycosyltransferase involved in cell wall biosynthesis